MQILPPFRRAVALSAAILGVLAAQSCGSGSTTTTPPGSGAISLSLSSAAATVAPGGQVVVVGTVTRSGGFTGDVAVTVTGAPATVTGAVGSVVTLGTVSTASVTLTVASGATAGTYPLTLTASGSGVSSVAGTFTLTISATAQTYTLSVAPTAASIAAGTNGTAAVAINRSGFTGSVALSVPNLPTGFTAAFSPNNTTGTSSTLTITVASSVAAGLYQLTIGGVATGQTDQLTFIAITVPAVGGYGISVAPTAVSVVQGGSNTATVSVSRTGGFTGNVGLTVTGNPALLSASFSPALVSGTSSTMTLTATGAMPVGSYQVTIHGSASGFASDQTVVITVNVTAATGGTSNAVVNFSGCAANVQPVWFAYQDGAGPWTVVTGANNVYQFTVSQPKVAFAYVDVVSASSTQTTILFYTNTELTSAPYIFCPATGTNSMSGTVAGLSAGQQASVSFARQAALPAFPATTYTLNKMFAGTADLVAYRTSSLGVPAAGDRFIVRRNQSVQNLGTIPLLDFGSAEAVAPASGAITVAGAGGGSLTAQLTYYTTNCNASGLVYLMLNPVSPFTAFGVPASAQLASDFHNLIVGATNGNNTMGVQEIFHTMGPRTITMPTAIGSPIFTVLSGNYKRLQAAYTLPTEYNNGTSFTYYDVNAAHTVSLTASTGYLGTSSVTIAMPSLSGLAGFLDSWMPATGQTVTTGVQASGSNFTSSICAEGNRLVSDNVTGSN